ncbi:MAG: glycosyltransferase family 2 protein [Moorea sp. SIO1G6]|uniref:Glycosyltransferase family 2 protein n=1 Tax=Moorena producens (strain JHB) TaxID=1454205 RepID=A0A1D9GA50_MOOP1|nr:MULTISPECIES: hemolytic protein HlpA-like protein [Moorena]AOY84345.1 glycosyltransferase family 2 protein [Moorena producens JHB]NET63562.1 glycosyltransferase family 2 protein [Moorena sp. SIO1G6]
MKTPVAFIIFKRPDTTERVFEVIRQAKPPKLLVIADGPRADRPGEAEKCAAARAIIERVDWDCEVLENYSDVNMGCCQRVSSGIDWVFNTVEEAIILEDDCLPHPDFFPFCENLLERYRDDERIMLISGTNFLGQWKSDIQSYHFSYYTATWGWASWRRAWNYYDINMSLWSNPEIKNRIRDVLANKEHYKALKKSIEYTLNGKYDAWDYRWTFAILAQSGLSVVPAVNLISNIGFGEDATHTFSPDNERAKIKTLSLKYPIKYNKFTAVDRDFDNSYYQKFLKRSKIKKIKKILKYFIK